MFEAFRRTAREVALGAAFLLLLPAIVLAFLSHGTGPFYVVSLVLLGAGLTVGALAAVAYRFFSHAIDQGL